MTSTPTRITLVPGQVHRVHTGVAVPGMASELPVGFLVKDRSSLASSGVLSPGGVVPPELSCRKNGVMGEFICLPRNHRGTYSKSDFSGTLECP